MEENMICPKELRKKIERDSVEKTEKKQKVTEEESGFCIRKGAENMDPKRVVELLRTTEWAKDRSEERILDAMEYSIPYGVFDSNEYMVGYARVMTDTVTTYYLMDVVVDERHRKKGLGRMLMDAVIADYGHLYGILHTESADWLYRKYGFEDTGNSADKVMERPGNVAVSEI